MTSFLEGTLQKSRRGEGDLARVCDVVRQRGGYWAIEWPSLCAYWESPLVQDFMKRVGKPIFQATATGCAFGLKAIYGKVAGFPMSKAWMIKGNMPLISEALRKPCGCNPCVVHAQASGANTEVTGRYTPAFVASVHTMFSKTVAHRRLYDSQ